MARFTSTPHLLTALAVWASLFLLLPSSIHHASAFGTQQPTALALSSRTARTAKSKYVSAVCSISGGGSGDTSDDNEKSPIFRQAALVGATTAAMAYQICIELLSHQGGDHKSLSKYRMSDHIIASVAVSAYDDRRQKTYENIFSKHLHLEKEAPKKKNCLW